MAFTQAQLDALEAAIAEGVLRVRYTDKEITYDSYDALIKRRDLIKRSLNQVSKPLQQVGFNFSKGLKDEVE